MPRANSQVTREIHYMLRKTLLLWKAEEIIEETAGFCLKNKIDEVIWKTDTEEFSHGLPELSLIDQYIPLLKKAKKRLDRINVLTSINPWVTLNHEDRGRDLSNIFPGMDWMVDYTGVSAKSCACPLSSDWQEWIREGYKRYATVEPHILWLEDDFRNFHHPPVEWGCFCKLHLESFSTILGRKMSREELVKCILRPGKPHPVRAKWFDFLGETMIDLAGCLEREVHKVSPVTRLGLMSSNPWYHSVEGRKWKRLLNVLAGPHEVVNRPSLGNYTENDPGLYYQSENMRRTVCCLPKPYRICPELENFPYTRFSKSITFTKAQIALSALMKAGSITMNLYDHLGSPIALEPGYGRMLKDSKPFFNALVERCRPEGKEKGVRILNSEQACAYTVLQDKACFEDLFPYDNGWAFPLQASGIPVTFEESGSIAITGQILRAFEDEIPGLFSKGVLLDLSAVETLIDMGYGEVIGVGIGKTFIKREIPISAEQLTVHEFGRKNNKQYMTLTHINKNQRVGQFIPKKGSRVISQMVDPDRREIMPGFVLFENSYGGRTAVYPFDLSRGAAIHFLNWHRKEQLKNVITWLNRGRLELFVGGGTHMIPYRLDYPGYTVIAAMNLSSDKWSHINTIMNIENKTIRRIEYLQADGKWIKLEHVKKRNIGIGVELSFPVEAGPFEMAVFTLQFKRN